MVKIWAKQEKERHQEWEQAPQNIQTNKQKARQA